MPLAPRVEHFLNTQAAAALPPVHTMTPTAARKAMESRPLAPGPELPEVQDLMVPSDEGNIPVRLFKPNTDGNLPLLIWMHGGGWVIGSVNSTDPTCRSIARDTPCAVISVEYRLAPEFRFPAALNDVYAVLEWAVSNAEQIGIDKARISIGGASAGGNLAAAVCLKARDENGPQIRHQLLVYPVVSFARDTLSYEECGEGYGLTHDSMNWFTAQYIESDADLINPYAAPLEASDHSNLPPALIITAGYDPLRDEGKAYADQLSQAGVSSEYECYSGMIHGFFNTGAPLDDTESAVSRATIALRAAFEI